MKFEKEIGLIDLFWSITLVGMYRGANTMSTKKFR